MPIIRRSAHRRFAHTPSEQEDIAPRRTTVTGKNRNQGGVSGAVGTEQAEDLEFTNIEGYVR